jgi:hypothetical protein
MLSSMDLEGVAMFWFSLFFGVLVLGLVTKVKKIAVQKDFQTMQLVGVPVLLLIGIFPFGVIPISEQIFYKELISFLILTILFELITVAFISQFKLQK